jgi:hypothetical protein
VVKAKTELLPVQRAAEVPEPAASSPWLVENLWSAQGVGVIGGAPKCGKTWLALDLAVSVASHTPALGRFPVAEPGPVLVYGAEDAPAQLRARLDMIARARGLALPELDLGLILTPTLRLDTERDRRRLAATVAHYKPRLLTLDPLVRLHRLDENSSAEMSALLAELRALQRDHHLAVILVHHLRKNAPRGQDGLSLRGSSDLYAWGDSLLFLRKRDRAVILTVEHRTAPAPQPCAVELVSDPAPHLRVVHREARDHDPSWRLEDGIVKALAQAASPLRRDQLRRTLQVRNASLGDALVRLRAQGLITRHKAGFVLRNRP